MATHKDMPYVSLEHCKRAVMTAGNGMQFTRNDFQFLLDIIAEKDEAIADLLEWNRRWREEALAWRSKQRAYQIRHDPL